MVYVVEPRRHKCNNSHVLLILPSHPGTYDSSLLVPVLRPVLGRLSAFHRIYRPQNMFIFTIRMASRGLFVVLGRAMSNGD